MSRYINIDDVGLRKTIAVGGLSAKALWKRIRQQPSIDIVRCKECKYYKQSEAFCENGNGLWQAGDECFCSYGERKESE